MRLFLWLVAGVFGVCVPALAQAPREYFVSKARPQIERDARSWASRGFAPVEELQVGVLGERDRDSLVLALEHGWQYVALGVCDEDCGDLDFHLFDPAGKEIAFDTKASEHAVVWTIPPADGTYRLEVVVRSCSTPPCYYAVQLLRGMPPPTPPAAPR